MISLRIKVNFFVFRCDPSTPPADKYTHRMQAKIIDKILKICYYTKL